MRMRSRWRRSSRTKASRSPRSVIAGLVAGKTAAPCRYIAADIENAGGHYIDEQLHVDDANGFKLITSRKPADLDYFVDAIKDALK